MIANSLFRVITRRRIQRGRESGFFLEILTRGMKSVSTVHSSLWRLEKLCSVVGDKGSLVLFTKSLMAEKLVLEKFLESLLSLGTHSPSSNSSRRIGHNGHFFLVDRLHGHTQLSVAGL